MRVRYFWYENGAAFTAQCNLPCKENFTLEELQEILRENTPRPGLSRANVRIDTVLFDSTQRAYSRTVFSGTVEF